MQAVPNMIEHISEDLLNSVMTDMPDADGISFMQIHPDRYEAWVEREVPNGTVSVQLRRAKSAGWHVRFLKEGDEP